MATDYIGVARPVVPPPPGVKSDLEIIQELAKRVGLAGVFDGDARDWKRRFLAPKLGSRGIALETLEERPIKNPLAPAVVFADRKFMTPSGRVNLITEISAEEPASDEGGGFPLYLMALSTDKSQSSQWAKDVSGPAVLTVHPDSARGIPDGGLCRLESRIGSMLVVLRHDSAQRRDVALTPKGGHLHSGRCANALVRARVTDIGEGGALYEERVRLVPLASLSRS